MRRLILAPLLLAAACASGPKARVMQHANGIKAVQSSTETALEFDLISADDAETVASILDVAIRDLKRAATAAKAGQPQADRLLNLVEDALLEAQRYLARKGADG